MECLKAALDCAGLGWRFTPLQGKRPYLKNWPERASNDPDTLKSWLTPGKNLGLATGKTSGVSVIDVDPRNGGLSSIHDLQSELGDLPGTVTCSTGGGGFHLYFRYESSIKSCKPVAGIDFQNDGRMVVMPPSVHPDTGALYEWKLSPFECDLAALPAAWCQFLSNGKPTQRDIPEALPQLMEGPYSEGSRNDSLFKLGCQWRREGLSDSQLFTRLSETNVTDCIPPLELDEVNAIYRQCLKNKVTNKSLKTTWQELVMLEPFPPGMKLTLMALSMFSDSSGGSCYPTQDQLAERVGATRKTIRGHLKQAEKEGWIKSYRRSRVGQGFNYGYVLTLKDG